MVFHPGESIKSFNLRFTKLYNKIHELIALIHYYNSITPIYKNRLEEKVVDSIATTLQTFLEYEDQILRTGLPIYDTNKSIEMTSVCSSCKT